MLERRSTVLNNRKGTTRQVFTSAPQSVYTELLADCDERFAVLMTPKLDFDQDRDFLIEVTDDGATTSFRTLYGKTPGWARQSTDWSTISKTHNAVLIAYDGMTF